MERSQILKFAKALAGKFSNYEQSQKDPKSFAHINIYFRPLPWRILESPSFYSEQSFAHSPWHPYRQGVHKVIQDRDLFIVENYALHDAERFAGGCFRPDLLDQLNEKKIIRRQGCSMHFIETGLGIYKGKVEPGNKCIINQGGKSSYLEIMCISIYGKPIPSRSIKGNPMALISKGKGDKDPAYTVVHIEINQSIYRINRIFDKDGKPKSRGGGVFKKNGDEWVTVCIDSPKIKEWVLKNVGNIDEFLMTTLVSQSNDSDFLAMKPVEQRSHLEKLLGLRVANSKANLFKQAFSITKSFKTNLDICLGESSNDSENVDELQAINAVYDAKKSLLKNLSSS